MTAASGSTSMPAPPRPETPFPLIRHLSARCTPVLARLPVTPNQITAASLVTGLGCAWALTQPGWAWQLLAAGLLLVSYVFDNSDGEIAVLKDQCTEFGRRFDDFADEAVHAAFFIGLGVGTMRATGQELWLWLGVIATAGATINYVIGVMQELGERKRSPQEGSAQPAAAEVVRPEGPAQWALFIFRDIFRSDFCFIVLALALVGHTWLLLPAAAVGAQAYWVTRFCKMAGRFHP